MLTGQASDKAVMAMLVWTPHMATMGAGMNVAPKDMHNGSLRQGSL